MQSEGGEIMTRCAAALAVDGRSGVRSQYALMMSGVSQLELYEVDPIRADLDRGIEVLSAVLRDPSPDMPRLGLAGVCLADAYRERSVLDEDVASLELSISTGRRAVVWSSGDPMISRRAHQNQAVVHTGRWHLLGERSDLNQAIASWRDLIRKWGERRS